jgi:drug/metabolite transporter (DMT)-like permease
VLPGLDRVSAAVAQLSVPVIALVGGVLLLNEGLSLPLALASGLVLTGIAISVVPVRSR